MAMLDFVGRLARVGAALALLGLALPALADPGNDNRAPDLGDSQKLKVEEGNKVAFYAHAEGVQIWGWDGTSWVFLRPEAILYAGGQGGIVGLHYSGPTWESASGSYVVGTVLDRATPNPNAIPWLLLGAVRSDGPGIFDGVTFIHRVNTVGGIAPASPGSFKGDVARVPYTADYFFYRASQ
jgi:uncharacterized protein DUF3455